MKFKIVLVFTFICQVSFSQTPSKGNKETPKEACDTCDSYDPELETPDIDATGMSHGYNLTPLGCLLYTPYGYNINNGGYNIAIYHNEKEMSSKGFPYSDLQKEIVFEFQRNGTLKYWFKRDYIIPAVDTIIRPGGEKMVVHTIHHSSKLHLKNIYTDGSWKANFEKHTLRIDFGPNNFSLLPLEGKYTRLGAGSMAFQQEQIIDSVVNGRKLRYKKVINSYFESY